MTNSAAHCKSCDAQIVWAVTENGRRMPVDADPVPAGTILLRHLNVGEPPVAHVTTKTERAELETQAVNRGDTFRLFVSHFATCPNATTHRQRPGAVSGGG